MNAADRFEGFQEKKLNLILHWIDTGEEKFGAGVGGVIENSLVIYTEFLEVY